MLPRTVRAINNSAANHAGRSARNIPHRSRARRKVAGRNMAAVIVRSRRPAAIAKVATNGLLSRVRKATSGVLIRVNADKFLRHKPDMKI